MIESVRAAGLEGVVAKRLDSRYEPGSRSDACLKMQNNQGQEFVIGGYTLGGKSFDALIFGCYDAASSGTSDELATASRRRRGNNCFDGSGGWRSPSAHSPTCPRRGADAG